MSIVRSQLPSSSLGYWRGSTGISGPSAAPVSGGTPVQGTSGLSSGTGAISIGGQSWHPSIPYLLALVVVEMIVFRWVGQILK